jgi:sugar/nucleoside kinase (ribokinase family)
MPGVGVRPRRLVLVGSVIVDVVMIVDALPPVGGDALARRSMLAVGGGNNVLTAAVRQGLPAVYGGRHGDGPFGDRVRAALAAEDVAVPLPTATGEDTGFCVALVDGTGERTFVTSAGAEAYLTAAELDRLDVRDGDAVYLSGYDLAYPHGPAVARWVAALPAGIVVAFDPGPLVADIATDLLEPVLARTDWLSLNRREAHLLTGSDDPPTASAALAGRLAPGAGVVLRPGADGCLLRESDGAETPIPVPRVDAVDTNGAGDVHVGAFLAALSGGLDPIAACRRANAAAAFAVARFGPAAAPTLAELDDAVDP